MYKIKYKLKEGHSLSLSKEEVKVTKKGIIVTSIIENFIAIDKATIEIEIAGEVIRVSPISITKYKRQKKNTNFMLGVLFKKLLFLMNRYRYRR